MCAVSPGGPITIGGQSCDTNGAAEIVSAKVSRMYVPENRADRTCQFALVGLALPGLRYRCFRQ